MTAPGHLPEHSMRGELSRKIKAQAVRLGFSQAGILPVGPTLTHGFYQAWLGQGHAGEMGYLHRHGVLKQNPGLLHPPARSVITLAHPYPNSDQPDPSVGGEMRGRISRYAQGEDYHQVLKAKLVRLAEWLEAEIGRSLHYRAFVDSGPLMERELAARAGLGWVGKNAMLIHWEQGSWSFLAQLLVDLPLRADSPRPPRPLRPTAAPSKGPGEAARGLSLMESCGSCTACIEACPTGAIVAEKTVDARRCISYLTIELKGPVPEALRKGLGDWVFGCDICQEVCPWNRKAPPCDDPALSGDGDARRPSLVALLALDAAAFRARFRHTPLWRTKRRGLLRNAAIALGNRLNAMPPDTSGDVAREAAREALLGAIRDEEPLVRGAAAWALGQMGEDKVARQALRAAAGEEQISEVRGEIAAALKGLPH